MKQTGFSFAVVKPDCDETVRPRETAPQLVRRLARLKASTVARTFLGGKESCVIIAADTTVSLASKILNKPISAADAERMLRTIQGRFHDVFTGYAVVVVEDGKLAQAWSRVVRTRVRIRKMSRVEIKRYVASGEPLDKAGAYGAQGRGVAFVEEVRGSYANVVGLPVAQLISDLIKKLGLDYS